MDAVGPELSEGRSGEHDDARSHCEPPWVPHQSDERSGYEPSVCLRLESRRPQTQGLTNPLVALLIRLTDPNVMSKSASILPFWKLQLGSARKTPGNAASAANIHIEWDFRLVCWQIDLSFAESSTQGLKRC